MMVQYWFDEQFLIDLPESETSTQDSQKRKEAIPENTNMEISNKRQRRNIRDLPQSSSFIFMSDDDNANIFECLKEKKSSSSSRSNRIVYEDMSSILLTLDVKQKKKKKTCSEKWKWRTDNSNWISWTIKF